MERFQLPPSLRICRVELHSFAQIGDGLFIMFGQRVGFPAQSVILGIKTTGRMQTDGLGRSGGPFMAAMMCLYNGDPNNVNSVKCNNTETNKLYLQLRPVQKSAQVNLSFRWLHTNHTP